MHVSGVIHQVTEENRGHAFAAVAHKLRKKNGPHVKDWSV